MSERYWRLLAGAGMGLALGMLAGCAAKAPVQEPVSKRVWLDQGWAPKQRQWFHHASQGTSTFIVPYEWFMALEQPKIELFGAPPLISDPAYLESWGFIPSQQSDGNPGGLPVGFARAEQVMDHVVGRRVNAVGMTCAGCHTGRLSYQGTDIYVDGGPAMTSLTVFSEQVGLALVYTRYVPGRLDRFADRVLGADASDAARAQLEKDMEAYLATFERIKKLTDKVAKESITEGFTRLDALDRIGNQVFALEYKDENFVPLAAPVNYPHIWSTSWFDWVQYDASIMQPMVRNAGEALGVRALINLKGPEASRFESQADIHNLYRLEHQLAGAVQPREAKAFTGLQAPRWPEQLLGKIDHDKAAKGRALYAELCQGCHMAPVGSDGFWEDKHWTPPNAAGEQYLKVKIIPIAEVGTDPMQARSLADRTLNVEGLGLKSNAFGAALAEVVERTVTAYYDKHGIPEAEREKMNGNRPNKIQAPMAYTARPLNGVWATAPYLHNGSVPNLYQLLSPAGERSPRFYLGSRSFDPRHVGFDPAPLDHAFELDASIPGNANTGHEFDHGERRKGLIGRYLAPEERWALVEYLKTL